MNGRHKNLTNLIDFLGLMSKMNVLLNFSFLFLIKQTNDLFYYK